MKAILNKEAVIKASKEVPPLFSPVATLEIAERIIQAYVDALGVGKES